MDFLGPIDADIIFKLFLSFVLGLILGIEREFAGKEAGPRTYSVVSLGATLLTIMSLDPIFGQDNARIVSQIIPGIGFIGAGLIIFHQSKVHGLSTAAGVWVTAAVGIAIGLGHYAVAVFAYFLAVASLYLFRKVDLENRIDRIRRSRE
jgi:putative Mg2+ transporter-C (MgtC) family protein